jgi:biopolymer transport protein ExbD
MIFQLNRLNNYKHGKIGIQKVSNITELIGIFYCLLIIFVVTKQI